MKLSDIITHFKTTSNLTIELTNYLVGAAKHVGYLDKDIPISEWLEIVIIPLNKALSHEGIQGISVCAGCGLPRHLGRCMKKLTAEEGENGFE